MGALAGLHQPAGYVFVQDTADKGLVGYTLFQCPYADLIQVSGRQSDIYTLVFPMRSSCDFSEACPDAALVPNGYPFFVFIGIE